MSDDKIYYSNPITLDFPEDVKSFWCVNERFAAWLFKHPRLFGVWFFLFKQRKFFK